ncbi:MAG: DNA gyrase inhibitor YacG [Halobacteriovoraceae bacterium]|jgi:uncharacterized protein|nr:DNA gyrase inhibitor YacG [Halobacteriovoraceae bacterium]
MEAKKLEVNCPSCKKKFNYYTSEFRPFCNERCKMVDMGHWFDESYAIAGKDNSVYIESPELLETLLTDSNED